MPFFDFFRSFATEIRSIFLQIKEKNSFAQNFSIIFSAKVAVFSIGIFLTPIVTRIYDPSAYGHFVLVNSTVVILGSLSLLKLPLFYTLPVNERAVAGMIKFNYWSLMIFSLLCVSVLLLFDPLWLLGGIESRYEWLIVPGVLLWAFKEVSSSLVIREKKFKKSGLYEVGLNLFGKGVTLSYGYFGKIDLIGLFLGEYAIKLFYSILFIKDLFGKYLKRALFISNATVVHSLKRYRSQIASVMVSDWLSLLVSQLPIFIIAWIFGADELGAFALAGSVLYLPLKFLGEGTIGPLMLQRVSELRYAQGGRLQIASISVRLINLLSLVAILPFTVLLIWGGRMFEFIFGTGWEMAGHISSIFGIYFFFRLIATPCASIVRVYEKENWTIVYQLAYLGSIGLVWTIGHTLDSDFLYFMVSLSGLYSLITIVYIIRVTRLAGISIDRIVWTAILIPISVFFAAYLASGDINVIL
jgi:O-antigen/teichoic acid export membrane protein